MNIIPETFNILKRHFELKDNYGNNPYMSKEKFEALVKDIQDMVSQAFQLGEKHGQLLELSKMSIVHKQFFDQALKEADINPDQIQSTSQYLKWREEFNKKNEVK